MQISEAESVVMEVLWARSPQSAEEVVDALAGRQEWQEATIKTLLNRLLNKGAVRAQREGRRYLYAPAIRREDWVLAATACTGAMPAMKCPRRCLPNTTAMAMKAADSSATGKVAGSGQPETVVRYAVA